MSFVGFLFVAFAAFIPFVISVLEGESLDSGLLVVAAWPLAFGLLILWFARRRAEISDTTITVRMMFRSIVLPWDELAHIRRSDAWLVIKDVRERSYRLGPYPRGAADFERDVRARRPHAISPVVAWNAEHEPVAERQLTDFAGFRSNDLLTTRQAIGVTLQFILILFVSLAIPNLGDFIGPLIKLGIAKPGAYLIAFCALVLLAGLASVVVSWLTKKPVRPDATRI
jgi:hypothetical protein